MPMNISLTPHLEDMIREKIASGSYNSASEVVREALRLLEQEDQVRALKMQNLRRDIREGLDSGPSKVFDPQEIKRAARRKRSVAERAAFKDAVDRLQETLKSEGLSEDEIVKDFKAWRSGRRMPSGKVRWEER